MADRDDAEGAGEHRPEKLSAWQRMAMRRLRREAGREGAEPLSEEDWEVLWGLEHKFGGRAIQRLWSALPHGPRCGMCGAPFAGIGRILTRPLGYRPSRKNPHLCATCVELSPPGGTTMSTGVLFADLRDFTSASEGAAPAEVSRTLRRFYGCAEDVLFPRAIIDKLIGDEVMALYLLYPGQDDGERETAEAMVGHGRELLRAVGYGSDEGPFVELGIGIDLGEAFVGNIGDRDVYDFTAVGDVVNTASRLQGQAAGGEVVISEHVAELCGHPGERIEVELKGKSGPQVAYRISQRVPAA